MADRKRILIDAPDGSTILAARHLDATEGPVQVGATVDTATRSAITAVPGYIAKAHNSPAAPAPEPPSTASATYANSASLKTVPTTTTLLPATAAPSPTSAPPSMGRHPMADISPAAQALLAAFDEVQLAEMHAAASARIKRVRELHSEKYGCGSCAECTHEYSVPYPCPTIRVFNGEEPQS